MERKNLTARRLLRVIANAFILRFLSRSLRHAFYRRFVILPEQLTPGLQFRLAESREELEAAFKLLHDVYVEQGFIPPSPSGIHLTLQHALPSTSTLIAVHRGRVVGTVSLIRDNPLGLPMENAFDVSPLRKWGSRIAEVTALAVDPAFRRDLGGDIFFPLLAYLYRYSTYYFGVGYYTAVVYPKHVEYYEAILGFEPLQLEEVPNYLGAPARGLFLDLRAAAIRYAKNYQGTPRTRNLSAFFLEREFPEFTFPDRRFFKVADPVMTPETLDYFFNKRTDSFSRLNDVQRITLLRQFNQKEYQGVIPARVGDSQLIDREERFDTEIRGRIFATDARGQRTIGVKVLQVSRSGFRALLEEEIAFGAEITATVVVGEYEIAELTAFPVWKVESVYGFRITSASQNWAKFIGVVVDEEYDGEFEQELDDPLKVA